MFLDNLICFLDILGAYEKTLLKENKIYDKITSILHLKGRNDMLNHNHFQKWGNDKFNIHFAPPIKDLLSVLYEKDRPKSAA